MAEKVFVSDNSTATLVCPECNASTTADISKYKDLEKLVKLRIACSCGKPYSVILERRRTFRKEVDLPGKYMYRPQGGNPQEGLMKVVDISRVGLRMKCRQPLKINAGAEFEVEFTLNDQQHTIIKKKVVARKVIDLYVHAEFCSFDASDPGDKALGFYLF